MSESTYLGGGDDVDYDPSELNTPIPSRAPSPTTSRTSRIKARVAERVDKAEEKVQKMGKNVKRGFKSFLGIGKPKDQGEGGTSAQDVVGSSGPSDNTESLGRPLSDGGIGTLTDLERGQEAITIASTIPSPVSVKDEFASMQSFEDALGVHSADPSTVQLGDNSLAVVAVELEPAATSGTPLPVAREADTTDEPREVESSFQPRESLASIATADVNIDSQSTVISPGSAEEESGAHGVKEDLGGSRTPAPKMARGAVTESTSATSTSKAWAIAKGSFRIALGVTATFVPEPFKGPVEALLKVVDAIEKANSNEKEVENLKNRCDLLGLSVVNAVKGKDVKLISEDLRNSVGYLMVGVWDTLEAASNKKSGGFAKYVLVEDDAEVLIIANKKLDALLQCFWIENHIAGLLVLSDIFATVQDHAEWMRGLSAKLDKHFENSTLEQLKRVAGAAYDSQAVVARVVPCFEGTRSALLAKIGRWMTHSVPDDPNPPIFVLDGIAGIGKSTVAITVAQRAAGINSLGASFFFSRDEDDQKKSSGFVQTIAYQLARYDETYGKAISVAINNYPDALDKVLNQQFDLLVAKPLSQLLMCRVTPLILVFDALDECVEPDASAVLKLIISSVSQLPNVKVFLTTRPEFGLRGKYMGTPNANVFHLQEIEDLIVEQDISLYVDYYLSPSNMQEVLQDAYAPEWQPSQEDKARLVQMSGKLFIFASTAVKFILDTSQLDPEGQLNVLLARQPDSTSNLYELDGLYYHILNSAKPKRNAASWLSRFKTIVGAILVLQTPLAALPLANLLHEAPNTIVATLANLHSILAPSGESSALIYKVHHKSFPDFITGPQCPSEFQISEEEHHLC